MQEKLLSILLVDDDSVDTLSLQRGFKKNNIFNPLHVANDGVDALDLLRGTNGVKKITPIPRIILLDLNMPKMDGLEFLKKLREDEDLQSTSVFVLISSESDKGRIEAHNCHVAGYINKPVTVENFITAVASLKNFWKLTFNDEPGEKEENRELTSANGTLN